MQHTSVTDRRQHRQRPVRGMEEAMGAQADAPVVHPAFGRGLELKMQFKIVGETETSKLPALEQA